MLDCNTVSISSLEFSHNFTRNISQKFSWIKFQNVCLIGNIQGFHHREILQMFYCSMLTVFLQTEKSTNWFSIFSIKSIMGKFTFQLSIDLKSNMSELLIGMAGFRFLPHSVWTIKKHINLATIAFFRLFSLFKDRCRLWWTDNVNTRKYLQLHTQYVLYQVSILTLYFDETDKEVNKRKHVWFLSHKDPRIIY